MYSLSEAIRGLIRNKLMTTVSIGVMSLSLLIFGTFMLITINLLIIVNLAQQRVQMEVFLKDITSDNPAVHELYNARTDTLGTLISAIVEVDSVKYTSKEMALAQFKKDYPQFSGLLGPNFNPLPASFIVYPSSGFRTSKYLVQVASKIEDTLDVALGRVEEISFGKAWIDKLDKWIKTITIADLIIGLIITIASVFVIANTIKLNIFARREQIAIMKLVGASDGLVSRPFLLEGSIQGIISGLLASSGLYIGLKILGNWAGDIVYPASVFFIVLSSIGLLFGLFGSWLSLRKYLVDPWIDEEIHKGA